MRARSVVSLMFTLVGAACAAAALAQGKGGAGTASGQPLLQGAPATTSPTTPSDEQRVLPRWRNSGTWRDDYDPRHDGRRFAGDSAAVPTQPGTPFTPPAVRNEPSRWGAADPRHAPRGAGRRFPQEWGDEVWWDRGMWSGRGRGW
jgi:hypothetical protein